ncbi:hypothetical protein KA012_04260 [Candidatus Woesebacteria bacterium]|nr:hypothetical protein [Candidatus Woesebacteria bacterium]
MGFSPEDADAFLQAVSKMAATSILPLFDGQVEEIIDVDAMQYVLKFSSTEPNSTAPVAEVIPLSVLREIPGHQRIMALHAQIQSGAREFGRNQRMKDAASAKFRLAMGLPPGTEPAILKIYWDDAATLLEEATRLTMRGRAAEALRKFTGKHV